MVTTVQLLLSWGEEDLAAFPTHQHSERLWRRRRCIPHLMDPASRPGLGMRPLMDPDQPTMQEGIRLTSLCWERGKSCVIRGSVFSLGGREEKPIPVATHTERHSGCDLDHQPRPGWVSIATHKFWDMILSISSQVWNILRPWTVFSVRDLKMTSSSGRST